MKLSSQCSVITLVYPKAKNHLLILLTATTVSSAYLAWQQSQRLDALRSPLLEVARTPTRGKTYPQSVEPHATSEKVTEPPAPLAGDKTPAPPEDADKPRPRPSRPDFSTLMENPEFAKAVTLQQRAALDERYANLFKWLQLPPAELEKFKNLLVERQTARRDVLSSAREHGVNPKANRDELQKLTLEAQAEVDASIKAALGDSNYNHYQNYDATLPQRDQVSLLDQRLSYSGTPLNPGQTELLIAALTPPIPATSEDANQWERTRNTVGITDAAIQKMQRVLTVEQLAALKQIQAEQQARQKIRDLMRSPSTSGTNTPRN